MTAASPVWLPSRAKPYPSTPVPGLTRPSPAPPRPAYPTRRWRPDRLLLIGLGYARPFVNWAFLVLGLIGTVGTAAGLLPPFGGSSLWARITNTLVWAIVAMQGYDALAEQGEEEIEEDEDRPTSGVVSGDQR